MRILDGRIVAPRRRHVSREHPRRQLPTFTAIRGPPNSPARDAERDHGGIARVNANGVDAWHFGSAAEPLLALRVIPQASHERPRARAVLRSKKTATDSATPELALPSGFEGPDLLDAPRP